MIISGSHKKSFFDALGIKKNRVVLFSVYCFFILFANSINGQTLIHTQEFETLPSGWTSVDNAGATSWVLSTGSSVCSGTNTARLSTTNGNDDWIMSQGFTLTSGKLYYITMTRKFTDQLDVYVGTAQTSANMLAGTNILSENAAPNCADNTTSQYLSTSTGTYYFGFRVRQSTSTSSAIDNIRIYEIAGPVTYYSKSTGNLETLSNWGTNTDGTGTSPSNFTTANQTFNIRNNSMPTIGAAWTVSGTGSKIVVGDGSNACNFTIPASYAVTSTVDVANNATLSIAHLTTNPTLGTLSSGSTVDYIGSGNQTIASGSYHHLKLSTLGVKTLIVGVTSIGGNLTTSGTTTTTTTVVGLTIGGNLTVGDGTTFTNAGHNLTVTGTTTIGGGTSGTLTFSSATNPAKTFTGLVTINTGGNWIESAAITPTFKGGISKSGTFNSSTGVHTFNTNSQSLTGALTIPSVTITSVTLTCNSSSDLTVNTALILDATGVLNMTTSQLLGSLTTLTNGGVIKSSNTGSTPLPTAKTWGGTVEYFAPSGGQTVIAGTYTNLTNLNTSGTNTASGAIVVNGTLTTSAGGTFDIGANALSGTITPANSGTIKTSDISATPVTTNLTWGGTFVYAATTGAQKIMRGTYNNLTLLNSSGTNTLSASTVTVNGTFTTTSGGTIQTVALALTLNGSVVCGASIASSSTSTVTYGLTTGGQNVLAGTYSSLTLSNTSGTNTACGNIVMTGTLTTSSGGVFDLSTYTLSGALTPANSGSIKTSNTSATPITTGLTWTGTVEYAASANQTLMSGTYNNLTVSGSGTKSLSGAVTVGASGVLTLTAGIISTNTFILTVNNTAAGAVSAGSSTSYIEGNSSTSCLKRKLPTSGTGDWIFPVGASSSYYPFTLTNPEIASSSLMSVFVTVANSNGSPGTCNTSISTSEYWTAITVQNLTSGKVSLGKPTLGSLNTVSKYIGASSAGSYKSRYGTVSGNSVINSDTVIINAKTSYFVLSTASSTAPSISTPTSASVSTSTVTLGGNITSIGCTNVTERGIYYSTSAGFADGAGTKVSVTAGPYNTGVFTISVTGLNPSTIYYYKAFATNSGGSTYTTQGTFTTSTPTFPVAEGFESDASGSLSSGAYTSSSSKVETGSWTINNGGGGCATNYLRLANGVSNQWYFTPLFYATSGKIYTVSYKGLNTASTASVNIYLATTQSSASANLTTDYFTGSGSTSFATETAQGWLCTSTGLYSFGFKVSSGGSALGLDCISIAETTPSTITWTGSSNTTNWSTAGNWDLARVPTSSDIIVVPSGKSYYPASVPTGSYNSLLLNNGTSGGTTIINTCTFAGDLTILSSSTGNTITIAGTTSVGGNISIGGSGSAFTFNCNASVTGLGTLVLGNASSALTSNFSYPINVSGTLTLGTNTSNVTNISYSSLTGVVAAIRSSNSGTYVFYGAVNYTATSGDQIVMKSQYNGSVTASGGGNRFMEGNLDINNNLTISGGKWYCGNPNDVTFSGTLGTDANTRLTNSPYKGSSISGRWQGIYLASEIAGMSTNDMITSISFMVKTKYSSNPYNNFTIKLAHIAVDRFTQAGDLSWPFQTPTFTTVFNAKDVSTVANSWNTHTFDTPFTWDGSSNILVQITFNNLVSGGGTGVKPNGTTDDEVAYNSSPWGNNIIVQTKSFGSDYTNYSNGANSNYKNYSIFNIAHGPYNINITNNWLNSGGSFYHLTNTVTFDGSTNQDVTTRGDNFYNYTVNNSCSTTALTLLDDNNVEGTATLTDGVITTGSNKLIILSSIADRLTGYSNVSFVKGNLRRYITNNTSTYGFPLGKGTATTDYFLSDIINNNLTTTTYLDGKFVSGTPADYTQASFMALGKHLTGTGIVTKDITSLDPKGYTQIDPNIQPGGGSYSFKMYSTNYTTSRWIDNNQCIMKRASASATLNDFNQAGTVNADNGLGRKVSDGYLLSTGLSSFSIFEPGLVTVVGLSVQLLDFNAVLRADKVYLDWSTQSEKNNDYFTIEKSQDGYTFLPLFSVKGYVNSQTLKTYQEIDKNPYNGVSYYRLKQTDTDGKTTYSQIRAVNYNLLGISVFPNPAIDNHFQIEFNSDIQENVDILIYDNIGQLLFQSSFITQKGINTQIIQLNHTAKGLYLLHIKGDVLGETVRKIEF